MEAHAARLRDQTDWDYVGFGYLNYSEPPFVQAVGDAVRAGAERITVLPYFLAPGYFVSKSLPDAVRTAQTDFPNVEFVVAPPLGQSDLLVDALLLSAQTARMPDRWQEGLARATQSCRPSPQCPLYETPLCPKMPGSKPVGEE